ncbi:MAG: hypothetical protein AB1499_02935 [Nitrospirota bacterium]
MKYIKTAMLFCFLPILISGCAASKSQSSNVIEREVGGEMVHDSVTIKPSGSYEECIELRSGLVFDYEFDATGFVNFNIHYHAEGGMHEPVKNKGVMFGKGTIDPGTHDFFTKEQEYYCMMWDNPNDEPVNVSFKCVLERKKESVEHMQH